MGTMRSDKTSEEYHRHLVGAVDAAHCPLCKDEPIKSFTYWKIIKNDYPYDAIAKRHDMLVPLRHVTEDGLAPEESAELMTIKREYLQPSEYDCILETTEHSKTIPTHLHYHLLVIKE